jgi:hypothetical protein
MKDCPWPPPSDTVADRRAAHVVAEVQSALDTATARAYKRGWDDAQRDAEQRASSLSAERTSALQQVSRLEVEISQLRESLSEAHRRLGRWP